MKTITESDLNKILKESGIEVKKDLKENYNSEVKIKNIRHILQETLDTLDEFSDNDSIELIPNTYGIGNYFMSYGVFGFAKLGRNIEDQILVDDEEDL